MRQVWSERKTMLWGGLVGVLSLAGVRDARACGCIAPPDPSVPIVQAGERILFAMQGGMVTAHIQIQYSGGAGDFGWLLPLPAVPTLELGTDELFNQLYGATQPKYKEQVNYEGNCGFATQRGFGGGPTSSGGDSPAPPGGPLVVQASIGPYDYAVLRADSKADMLTWLNNNHYYIPVATDASVAPYIHVGAYFLALKLHAGATTGDLQPVVVKYASDLPMVPIILTSVGAKEHMGIQVWMLGAGRAIPRNYYHTLIDDALIDWQNAGQNYNDVIIQAVGEANGKHSFVTEYAGASTPLQNTLSYVGRFGSIADLAASADAASFVQYLFANGYGQLSTSGGGPFGGGYTFTSALLAILDRYLPEPPKMVEQGVPQLSWLQNLSYYLSPDYQAQHPGDFVGWTGLNYQPLQMANEINQRVVQPTLAAGALFDQFPYLTRLYTTLSPADMTQDPVFSFNPDLPDVSNIHTGTLTYLCGFYSANAATTPARLVTEQGFVIEFPHGTAAGPSPALSGLPGSSRIEILREQGGPEVVTDNASLIGRLLGGAGGCAVALGGRAGAAGAGTLALLGLGLLALRRRRR